MNFSFKKDHIKWVAAFVAAFAFGGATGWLVNDIFQPENAEKVQHTQEIPPLVRMKAGLEHKGIHPQPELGTAMTQNTVSETVAVLNQMQKDIQQDVSYTAVAGNEPRWQKNAKPVLLKDGFAKVAIVIDDVGVVRDRSEDVVRHLPNAITLSFLPYGEATEELSKEAFERGHEVMIHLPMQPKAHEDGYIGNPGPNALFTTLGLEEVRRLTDENFKDLAAISVGVNNHMGSAFTEWKEGMEVVLEEVAKEHLMFMDSVTTPDSEVSNAAEGKDIPLLKRDIFLDDAIDKKIISKMLEKVERVAKAQGSVIVIGHPHPETTAVLKEWLGTLEEKRLQLVPITTLIEGK